MGPRPSGTSAPPAPSPPRVRPGQPGHAAPGSPHKGPARTSSPASEEARLRVKRAEGSSQLELPDRDIRSKRPPALSFLLRMSTLRRLCRLATLLGLDFAGIALAIFTALVLKEAAHGDVVASRAYDGTRQFLPFAYLITVLLFALSGQYAARAMRPGLSRIVGSLFQVALVALVFAVVNGEHFSSYYLFYGSLAFALLYVSTLRALYEKTTAVLLRAAGYERRALLVGRGKHISDVAHALRDASHSPIEVVGFLSPSPLPENGVRSLGSLDDLERVLASGRVDEVIIADPEFPQDDAVELVDQCHQRGVRVRLAPSTMEILIHRAEFIPGQSLPLFELGPPVFEGVDFALKRTFDIVGATLLLILLSPLLLAITLAVRITSRGPVLYRSMRRGIGQRPFACLKFRTMHSDAEERQDDLEALNEASGALFKIRDDPRLTRVGRELRRFSLDELPQLINVLRGEMSLVGPRPLPERDYRMLEEWHRKRYLVLPGITGLWQVSGRSELDFDDLVHLDFIYLERWSLALDLTILLKTIPAVFSRRGAY
jgi:exopolysaccharide biosynthesis polyprenyl glycosylphosphotransferase